MALIVALAGAPVFTALAQTATPPPATDDVPSYKPPLRGAPGGRVGGASRGAIEATPLSIELLAPDGHAGLTTDPSPTLYYYASRAVSRPLTVTISGPMQPHPLIETALQPLRSAGIQAIRLADYKVQLLPNILYSWSVSLAIDPQAPSRDIVATASIMRVAADQAVDAAVRPAPPLRRAALLAQAGLWYDAVAAAVDGGSTDRHKALDALLDQVGLTEAAAVDRQTVR
jgi:hypothetical protein